MIPKGITCVMCGKPVRGVPALEPGGGQGIAAALWLCKDHRHVIARQLGEAVGQSAGRPAGSPVDARIAKYRGWRKRRSSSQAPAPSPPRMSASSPSAPSPPRMPRPTA
jgi:hypothetical protein